MESKEQSEVKPRQFTDNKWTSWTTEGALHAEDVALGSEARRRHPRAGVADEGAESGTVDEAFRRTRHVLRARDPGSTLG